MKMYMIACPSCNGSGKAPYLVRTSDNTVYVPPGDPSWQQPVCDTCKGKGEVEQYIWEPGDFEKVRKILYPDSLDS